MHEHPQFREYVCYRYPSNKDIREKIIREEARKFEEKVERDLKLIGFGITKETAQWTH